MTVKAEVQAQRRVDLFLSPVSVLVGLFDGTEEGLSGTSLALERALFLNAGTTALCNATSHVGSTYRGRSKLLHL